MPNLPNSAILLIELQLECRLFVVELLNVVFDVSDFLVEELNQSVINLVNQVILRLLELVQSMFQQTWL